MERGACGFAGTGLAEDVSRRSADETARWRLRVGKGKDLTEEQMARKRKVWACSINASMVLEMNAIFMAAIVSVFVSIQSSPEPYSPCHRRTGPTLVCRFRPPDQPEFPASDSDKWNTSADHHRLHQGTRLDSCCAP